LIAAALGSAIADELFSWSALASRPKHPDGLFSAWSVHPHKLLAALRSAERASGDKELRNLELVVRNDPTDLLARDQLAVAYWRRGRFGDAVAQFRQALALDPAFLRGRLNLAESFLSIGRGDFAENELLELIQFHPSAQYPRRRLAELYASRGRPRDAAAVLRELVRVAPTDLHAHLDLGRALIASDPAAAKPVLEAARALAPADPAPRLLLADAYRALGDSEAARKELEEARKSHPRSDAARQLGLLHLRLRDFRAAREVFQQVVESPDCPPSAIAGLAVAAQGSGDDEAAIATCRRIRSEGQGQTAAAILSNIWLARGDATAIRAVQASLPQATDELGATYEELLASTKADPRARPELALQLSLAGLFRQAGWPLQAAEAAEAARKLAPKSLAIGHLLATCYGEAGRADDELRIRERLATEHPDSSAASCKLARTCLDRGQTPRAHEVARAFLKRYHDDLEARLLAAEIALRDGDCPTALADARLANAKHPLDDRALAILLDACGASGSLDEAAEAVRRRQATDPAFVPGPLQRALLAAAEGRPDEALDHCKRAISQAPLDPRPRTLAGVLNEKKGDLAEALDCFRVAQLLQPQHLPGHLAVARVAKRAGLVPVAIEAELAAAALAPQRLDLRLELADTLSRNGQHTEALDILKSLKPANTRERHAVDARIAGEALAQGDPRRALLLVEPIVLEQPAHLVARRVAALAYRELGDVASAAKLCERARQQARATDLDAELGFLRLLQQQYKEANDLLTAATGKAERGIERFELRRWQATACIALGLAQKAREALEDAFAARRGGVPASPDLLIALAVIGGEEKARSELTRLEATNPTGIRWLRAALPRFVKERELAALTLTAYAASSSGWHRRAAELLEAALKLAPGEPFLLYMLTRAQLDAGLLNLALDSARELIRIDPRSGEAHHVLGFILDRQGKADAALDAYRRALPFLDRHENASRLSIAQRLAAAGRIDEAIDAYRKAIEADPSNAAACNNLAWLYASHKPDKLAEAESLALAATKAAPGEPAFRDTLGWIYFLRRKHDAARAELQAALALAPGRPTYLYHLGMVDFVQGRRDPARRALRFALALEPAMPEAQTARATLKLLEAEPPPAPQTP
jgi:tetratricopeptide (TPR) repeat protein